MRAKVRRQVSGRSLTTLMSAAHAAGFAMVHVDDVDRDRMDGAIDDPAEHVPGVAGYVHGYVDVSARRPKSQALVVTTGPAVRLTSASTQAAVADWFRSLGVGMLGGRVATP